MFLDLLKNIIHLRRLGIHVGNEKKYCPINYFIMNVVQCTFIIFFFQTGIKLTMKENLIHVQLTERNPTILRKKILIMNCHGDVLCVM